RGRGGGGGGYGGPRGRCGDEWFGGRPGRGEGVDGAADRTVDDDGGELVAGREVGDRAHDRAVGSPGDRPAARHLHRRVEGGDPCGDDVELTAGASDRRPRAFAQPG